MIENCLYFKKTIRWEPIWEDPIKEIKKEKRKQKKIDRICWKRDNFK